MPQASLDRELLFALLALQNNLVAGDALVECINTWAAAKDRPLGELLVERRIISVDDRKALDALIDQQIAKQGSPSQALSAMDLSSSIPRVMSLVADAGVQSSLAEAGRTGDYVSTGGGRAGAPGEPRTAGPRYRVLRPHARGGLGEVYVAEDTELRREVALKEIRGQHADNQASRWRFVAEAEITGRLEHPGIVPVYGLGSHEDGRPFYAMRFIQGDNLQAATERFHKSGAGYDSIEFRQLLGRFVDVCNAVAYAHSRGVLHRDLKPGNVMLGNYGETLLVDWGLAKIVGQAEGAEGAPMVPVSGSGSVETMAGSAIGTPAYMSTEQAEGKIDELGPATDVYSLGATLYAVLTNKPPLEGAGVVDVLDKVVRGDVVPAARAKPGVPAALSAVCARAMALKPVDRYDSAQALSADVEHWLADEPVAAMPDPVTVRARRWARKHPGPVTGIAAALVVGVVGLAAGLYFVNAEKVQKELARQGEETQRIKAERRATEARERHEEMEAVLTFVQDRVFAAARPEGQDGGLGHEVTLKKAMLAALPFIADGFKDRPLTEARLRTTMGTSFWYLSQPNIAEGEFRRARDLYLAHRGADHPDTLKIMNNLALSYADLGRHPEALALREETLKLQKAKLGLDHPDTLASMSNLAVIYSTLGRYPEALALREETLKLQKTRLGPEHPDTLASMLNLSNSYASLGRPTEALALHQETLTLHKATLGPEHPDTLHNMSAVANGYFVLGRHAEALTLHKEIFELRKLKLGLDHDDTFSSMNDLAVCYSSLGRTAEALALDEETYRLRKAKLGPDHAQTLSSMNNLAVSYSDLGRHAESLALNEEALKLLKGKLGLDHPRTIRSMSNLAENYADLGRHQEALVIEEEALKKIKAKLGFDHPNTLQVMYNLATRFVAVGRGEEGLPLIEDALRRANGKAGLHPRLVPSLFNARGQISAAKKDVASCRANAEEWENLERPDADSLYAAAHFRAVCAGLDPKGNDADKAVNWLKQAIAVGYKNVAQIKKDIDLDTLRGRDDFKALIAELEAKYPPAPPKK